LSHGLEVLRRTAAGEHVKEMARELDISPKTIYEYLAEALARLHVSTTAEAVAIIVRAGLA
jgi:DNA-binding CsgD family transcriptional regulator